MILSTLLALAILAIVLWSAGALYFDFLGASPAGAVAGAAWVAAWLALFMLWRPPWQPLLLLGALFALVLWRWLSLRPSQDRDWDPHFAHLARIAIDGDAVAIENLRNSDYGENRQSTPRFETREVRLSQLAGVDALILTWGSPWMSHPMFVFDFGPGGRVCISIEVRYRRGQPFSFFRTLYRQQELIYVVSDERDAILRRTKWLQNHNLYLYRLQVDELEARQFFLDYANRVNRLACEPAWYHGLTANCTMSVYWQSRQYIRWHWRLLLNGSLDRLLYDRGRIARAMPFDELKRQSWINDLANRAPVEGFGDYIRDALP
ncbi:MAG TPA: DUF4105 domain-containing protein [Lacipirellulaceae bacterium]|nr:DUF4105 domain-containing protein [Lacipirellulaceae bacterium]